MISFEDKKYGIKEVLHPFHHACAKRDINNGVFFRPVPVVFKKKALEEFAFAKEGLAQGIKKEGLAKAPRARKKVVFTFVYQFFDKRGFVDVVVILGADDLKALDTDGEFARHKIMLAKEKKLYNGYLRLGVRRLDC